jgi:hypothetical protein
MGALGCHAWFALVGGVPLFASTVLFRHLAVRRARRLTSAQAGLVIGVIAFASVVTTVFNGLLGCDVTFNPHEWRSPRPPWSWLG